ncbi:MAG: helix-turn-helix domain-containing protein [Kiritimatiellae bacterium]|nr:helix-turn-helix domain-containing protein [Kiritimatiellia bacterium]
MAISDSPIGLTAATRVPVSREAQRTGSPPLRHQHPEIEMVVYDRGPVTMSYGGRRLRVPPRQLLVFWGAMEHYAMDAAPGTLAHIVYVPLSLAIRWELPKWFMRRLFEFQVLVAPLNRSPCPDSDLLKHWVHLISISSFESERIVALEVEARLRRLVLERRFSHVPLPRAQGGSALERMVETIAQRCLGPLRIPDIAKVAGLTPEYAMRLFRRHMGLTMLEHITRQRVSHAQRLLATTNRGVLDIMEECGFRSPTRFYTVFRRFAGRTPARYRRLLRQ